MELLHPCESCHRHTHFSSTSCPFCEAPTARSAALLATVATLALSGCPDVPIYAAPDPTESSGDESGDEETGGATSTQGEETETGADGESTA